MTRIFVGLAGLNAVALVTSFVVGCISEGRAATPTAFTVHFLVGIGAVLVTLLLHCLTFTYFMGTGRWVQEVVAAYRLPESLWLQAREHKSRTLPPVLGSILLVGLTATLGAASDVGILHPWYHLALALVATGFNFWSYVREFQTVRANGNLLYHIMSEVTRMRRERGLS